MNETLAIGGPAEDILRNAPLECRKPSYRPAPTASDTEAQVGQGPITFHSEEHLMSSDRGVAMLRLMLQKQVDIVAKGGDPAGVTFSEKDAYVRFDAGQFLDD